MMLAHTFAALVVASLILISWKLFMVSIAVKEEATIRGLPYRQRIALALTGITGKNWSAAERTNTLELGPCTSISLKEAEEMLMRHKAAAFDKAEEAEKVAAAMWAERSMQECRNTPPLYKASPKPRSSRKK